MSTITSSDVGRRARVAARSLAALDGAAKDAALAAVAAQIRRRAGELVDANRLDMAAAADQRPAIRDRLMLDHDRCGALADAVESVAALSDPIGSTISDATLDNGLQMTKLRVPLGVVMVVYEARPNVTVDAAVLCIKAGNACILRGSRLAEHTNRALLDVMRDALAEAGLPADAVQALSTDRAELAAVIADPSSADVVIPRGGEQLKQFLLEHSRIPVLAAAGGNCHVYVDAAADPAKALAITVNAKVQRPGVCNAAETLLVHRDRADLVPALVEALEAEGVEVLEGEQAWATEFLDLKMALRVVDDLDQALDHIDRYGTGHSEAIVTEDAAAAGRFTREVDAAAVYVNASTRFTDGAVYGMGAEIGISTNRLHARGPLGLEELTTTKYVVIGDGQTRS
ncbi:MAG: glutamate-5-semialdehyde dehydrogenase [Gaiellales bacterium]|nr:glutamate-5-semialdehyde dehydrogenase [Gaiellales bacterium]MDX6545526.1 glutamate-5-semialdehyde dehydrogenase [Gaiellales bacterium]MDX6551183.1 glutamate-5-semialdehyde dehydrogenase [Gaiellales bacterium]